jgi:hypothetical protein
VVAIGSAGTDLGDAAVLPGDECISERRTVDGNDPVGGNRVRHVSRAAAFLIRRERRSRKTEIQIEVSKRIRRGIVSSVTVTGSTPGSATARQATAK